MNYNDNFIIITLKSIFDTVGIDALKNHSRAKALIMDFFPGDENGNVRNLIYMLVNANAFTEISNSNDQNHQFVLKKLHRIMVEDLSISADRAELALNWVCKALGKKELHMMPKATPKSTPAVTPKREDNTYGNATNNRPTPTEPEKTRKSNKRYGFFRTFVTGVFFLPPAIISIFISVILLYLPLYEGLIDYLLTNVFTDSTVKMIVDFVNTYLVRDDDSIGMGIELSFVVLTTVILILSIVLNFINGIISKKLVRKYNSSLLCFYKSVIKWSQIITALMIIYRVVYLLISLM